MRCVVGRGRDVLQTPAASVGSREQTQQDDGAMNAASWIGHYSDYMNDCAIQSIKISVSEILRRKLPIFGMLLAFRRPIPELCGAGMRSKWGRRVCRVGA
jgi:hypothetical protein